ncbi:MAG TPA: rod shape-determining protein, partial [Planctomycetes bacterium]|nr:rod shape-determining protein [Planctomycetota bacterium]
TGSGILLAGGGALLRGLDEVLQEELDLDVKIAEDPLTCVARGTGIVLSQLNELKEFLYGSHRR